jgi:hypothetical protein
MVVAKSPDQVLGLHISQFVQRSLAIEDARVYLCISCLQKVRIMLVGYARVSTLGQDVRAQFDELTAAGCGKVHRDKASGARTDRPVLARLLKRLQPGDVLVVTRLDRLARSSRDLLNVLEVLKQSGVGFRSLRDAWCDTGSAHGQLMLTILALQLRFLKVSESMGNHDSKIVDAGGVD